MGMLSLFVYLCHTEGATSRNKAIFRWALATASSHGSPWVIAGEFNTDLEMILAHSGETLERVDAYVLATGATHCPTSGARRTVDFVVGSATVEPWIKAVAVDRSFETSPHEVVRIATEATPKNM